MNEPNFKRELIHASNAIFDASPTMVLREVEQQARRLASFDSFDTEAIVSGLCESNAAQQHADRETLEHIIRGGIAEISVFQPTSSGRVKTTSGLEMLCMADVKPKAIDWLWQNWIAIGKVCCLAGDGGKGKSTILCDIAGRTTNGEAWPDGASATKSGSVIILAAEDDVEDTVAPRLMTVGADLKRIFTIRAVRNEDQTRRTFNLGADLARLEAEIMRLGDVRLVIIDPISSYLGKVDSHKNAEVRMVLEPLAEMASRLRVAIVCNNHFSKGGGNANSRIIGSVAFVNQARAAFIVSSDPEDQDRLFLIPSKNNIAPIKHGLAYRIEGSTIEVDGKDILTSRIAWETTLITISADQALAAHDDTGEAKTANAEAVGVLKDLLSRGEMPAKDAETAARNAGVTSKPLRNAKGTLGVVTRREGFGPGAVWFWSLPTTIDAQPDHRCPAPDVGAYDA